MPISIDWGRYRSSLAAKATLGKAALGTSAVPATLLGLGGLAPGVRPRAELDLSSDGRGGIRGGCAVETRYEKTARNDLAVPRTNPTSGTARCGGG
jgi:hypothetical protein